MKILRKMGVVLFSILLVNLIGLFIFSKEIKPLLTNGIIKEVLLKEYLPKITNNTEIEPNKYSNILEENKNNEALQEILKSPEVDGLINKYLDTLMNSITSDEKVEDLEIEEDIFNYLKNNKSTIEKVIKEEIPDEKMNELEEEIKKAELSKSFKEIIERERNNIDPNIKKIISIFSFFTSQKFRIYCIIGIIISLILISLLEFSLYKWLKVLGISFITTGICTIIMSLLIPFTINRLSTINLDLMNLTTIGIGLLIYGTLFVVIYKIIAKQVERKKLVKSDLSKETI